MRKFYCEKCNALIIPRFNQKVRNFCNECVRKQKYGVYDEMSKENIDYIICPLCNKRLRNITNSHIKICCVKFGIKTLAEFREKFGLLICETSSKAHSIAADKSWGNPDEKKNNIKLGIKKGYENGRVSVFKGKKWEDFKPKEWVDNFKDKQRARQIERIAKGLIPTTNTKPFRVLSEAIQKENIYFKSEFPFCVTVIDIAFPKNKLAVYVDGNYWHKYPVGLEKDKIINKWLEDHNWKVLRFWETEIYKNVDKCVTS